MEQSNVYIKWKELFRIYSGKISAAGVKNRNPAFLCQKGAFAAVWAESDGRSELLQAFDGPGLAAASSTRGGDNG